MISDGFNLIQTLINQEDDVDSPVPQVEQFNEIHECQNAPWNWETIKDWSRRTAAYDDRQKAYYDRMVPLFDQFRALRTSPGWNVIEEKDGITVETKKSDKGFLMMRCNATLNYPPKDVFRFMININWKTKWDTNIEKVVHLKKVGVNAQVTHLKTKKVFVVSSRDFIVNYLCNEEEDGTITDVQTSNDLFHEHPEQPNTVRCHVYINGLELKPIGDNNTSLFIATESDIKGIPDWVLKQALKDQVTAINNIRKLLPQWKKENPNE